MRGNLPSAPFSQLQAIIHRRFIVASSSASPRDIQIALTTRLIRQEARVPIVDNKADFAAMSSLQTLHSDHTQLYSSCNFASGLYQHQIVQGMVLRR